MFNSNNYRDLSYHICMQNGSSLEENDLNKWKMIHELCNKGKYGIINERNNANSIFRKIEYNKVFEEYSKLKKKKLKEVVPLTPAQKEACRAAIERKREESMNLQPLWLCKTKHTRTQRVFDISDKVTVLRNLNQELQRKFTKLNQFDRDEKLNGHDWVDDISDMLATRYASADDRPHDKNDRQTTFKRLMQKRYTQTYFIVDCNTTVQKNLYTYVIMGALILEDDLKFDDGNSIAVIHSFAPDFEYEEEDQIKCLLSHVFSSEKMREKTVVFVSSYNENNLYFKSNDADELAKSYTMVDLFKEMKFVEAILPTIQDDIITGSTTMIGNAEDIHKYCKPYEDKKKPIGSESQSSYLVMSLCNRVKLKFKYDGKKFMSYSHPFHWHRSTSIDISQIPVEKQKAAKKNKNVEYFFSGSGYRQKSELSSSRLVFAEDVHLKAKFLQASYSTENNCAWLSTACLIDRIDEEDAVQMIKLFEANKGDFEWIPIRGNKNVQDKKVSSTSGKKSLMQLLNEHIGYTLHNVPRTKKGYMNQIIDDIKHGKYVCLLKFSNSGGDKHVIGIDCDCDPKLIFDCMEPKAMPLTRANLNNLSGEDDESIFLKEITLCYRLDDNNKKRKFRKI